MIENSRLGLFLIKIVLGCAVISGLLLGSAGAQAPPAGNVGWWRGDNNANDSTGTRHGTMQNGATFSPGTINQAFNLNAADDFMTVVDPYEVFFTGVITVEYWFRNSSTLGNDGPWLGQSTENVDNMGSNVWLMHQNGDGVSFLVNDNGNWRQAASNANLADNTWHHIAGVTDATSTRLYVDGALIDTGPGISSGIRFNLSSVVQIGKDPRYPIGSGRQMSGLVDELRIYDAALTQAQIQAIAGTTPATPPTVTSIAASGVSTNTATLNSNVNPNGAATNAFFQYSTDSGLAGATSTANQAIGGGTGAVGVNQGLGGLSPHTQYFFRAVGTNSSGTTNGAILNFTTGNTNPTAPNATVGASTGDQQTYTLPYPTNDADGDPVTLSSVTPSANLTVNSTAGNTVTFTPAGNSNGTGTLNYAVVDGFGGSASGSITVNIVDNDPPVVSVPAPIEVNGTSPAGAVVSFTPTATDNIAVTSLVSSPASGSTFPYGTTTVNVTAMDATGNSDSDSFTVTVYEAPKYNFESATFSAQEGGGTNTTNVVTVTRGGQTMEVSGTVGEGGTLNLNAPPGFTFTAVQFASYGLPTGAPGSYMIDSNCHSTTSEQEVANVFLGTTGGSIQADNSVFGDPCPGTVKRLSVTLIASGSGANSNPNPSSVDIMLSSGASNGATPGTDFTAGPITVNFGLNETSKTVPIEILGDATVELDETVLLSFASDAGTTIPISTLTISNDDSATLIVSNANIAEGDSGDAQQLSFDVTLGSDVDSGVDVPFTTATGSAGDGLLGTDSDYVATSGTLNFSGATGQTLQVVVDITEDDLFEADETMLVNFSAPQSGGRNVSLSASSVTGTIDNDDFIPQVTPPGIADVIINTSSPQTTIPLFPSFQDDDNTDTELTYTVTGNTNTALIQPAAVNSTNGLLSLNTPCTLVGSATITITATDLAGQSVTDTFTVTVVDDVRPVLELKDIIVTVSQETGQAILPPFSFMAVDKVDGALPATCTPDGSAPFPIGVTPVSCSATDLAGNTVVETFNVVVLLEHDTPGERFLDVISLRGDDAIGTDIPEGAKIFNINRAYINNSASIIYDAALSGAGSSNVAVFTGTVGGAHDVVAVKGAAAPGGTFGAFAHLSLNDGNDCALQSMLGSNPAQFADTGGGINLAARKTGLAPTGGGEDYNVLQKPALASDGSLLVVGSLRLGSGAGVTVADDTLVARGSGELLAREDSPSSIPTTDYGQIHSRIVASEDNDRYAFSAYLMEPTFDPSDNTGLFAGILDGGAPQLVVREGDSADGTSGATFSNFLGETVNSAGETVLRANVSGSGVTSTNNEGLWTNSGNTSAPMVMVAREGDVAPCLPNNLAAFSRFTAFYLADDGSICFHAFLKDATSQPAVHSANDGSLWRWRDGDLHLIAREGDLGNNTADSVIRTLGNFSYSGTGAVVYEVSFVNGIGDTTTSTNLGAYLDRGVIDPVPLLAMRRGDTFDLAGEEHSVVGIKISVERNTGGGTGGYGRSINDAGQIVLNLSLNNNKSGIFVLGGAPQILLN